MKQFLRIHNTDCNKRTIFRTILQVKCATLEVVIVMRNIESKMRYLVIPPSPSDTPPHSRVRGREKGLYAVLHAERSRNSDQHSRRCLKSKFSIK